MNRLTLVENQATGGPDYNMRLLLDYLDTSGLIPSSDKYYVFVYRAKSPGITYDQHPFVKVENIYKWGFTALNYHWGEMRRYSWREVISNIYEVYQEEFDIVQNLNIAKFVSN